MAESSRVGSYRCEFIDDVPEHLVCGLCKHAANGPSITTCCGELFCQACIASALEEKRLCPSCKESTFSTFLNPKYERSIKKLRVHCTMKDCGCQWTGQLEQLDAHLEVETGDCEYVDIECPEKCGQQIQKHQLATHIANECPERDFVCMYCGFKATYAIISNKHWPECQNYPVPCPNDCSIGAVECNILEDHLNTCPLQVVECAFNYAGCNKKLQRQDMEKHVEESTQEHLALMAAASVRMSWEFEQKLQEQRDEFREYLKQKEKETAGHLEQKDNEIKHFQESFQKTQKVLQVATEKLQELERQNVERNKMLQAQIVDLRNQMEIKDEENQRKLQKEEEKIKVLGEQLQWKNKEIQNLQQADERLRENLQRNERESKEKEKQLQEQLQVKHEQAKQQQMIAVEKQLKTQSKEFQVKLKENEKQTQQKLEREVQQLQRKQYEFKTKQDRQTQAVETKMTDIEKQIQEKTTQIEKRVRDCENYDFPPIIIDNIKIEPMTNWKKMAKRSEFMYTHSGGYKFWLRIWEDGQGEGQGTHVSVELVPSKGPFDNSLQWPAKCTMTLQLLNQHRDQDHVTVTKKLEWPNPIDSTRAVTFSDKLIAHDDLRWNAEKHTQYLKDNCFHFRIARVWT